jgi:hypothetical protein
MGGGIYRHHGYFQLRKIQKSSTPARAASGAKRPLQTLAAFNRSFSEAIASALALGWQTESEQQDFLSWPPFSKQKVACRELFSNYHGA